MTHDERVTRLAERMAIDIVGNGRAGKYHADDVKDARPYAAAMVQAEEALTDLLESPASFEDARIDYAERQVGTRTWEESKSALAALRALEAK